MNVLLINGSPHKSGCTFTALSEIAGEMGKDGIESRIFHVGTKAVRGCIACGQCGKTGYCAYTDDPVNECIDLIKKADGLIVGSPVYYASPNGALLALLDRVFYAGGGALPTNLPPLLSVAGVEEPSPPLTS
jgi:multimeric flavodoxin WrbA